MEDKSPAGGAIAVLPVSLVPPSRKTKRKYWKSVRAFRSVFRSLPILTPTIACNFPSFPGGILPDPNRSIPSGTKLTGTLFAHRKGRVSLSLQDNSRCLPMLVIQLAVEMSVIQKDLGLGIVRIALECEKRHETKGTSTKLMDETVWTMYYSGKKVGFGIRREAEAQDLYVMELLKSASMAAGVLPPRDGEEDGDVVYIRAQFEHVVGSKDVEMLYMLSPEGNNGPDLTVFMLRL